jgi:hypothetical protein
MPKYQAMTQSGPWSPGGAARVMFNPMQRPGIGVGQLAIGQSLLPSTLQLRGADSLDNQGVGIVPLIMAAVSAAPAVIDAVGKKKGGGGGAAAPASSGEKWKWPGGKSGDVDAEGHVYGSPKSTGVAVGSFLRRYGIMLGLTAIGGMAAYFYLKKRR